MLCAAVLMQRGENVLSNFLHHGNSKQKQYCCQSNRQSHSDSKTRFPGLKIAVWFWRMQSHVKQVFVECFQVLVQPLEVVHGGFWSCVTPEVYEAMCLSCLWSGLICLPWILQSFEKYTSEWHGRYITIIFISITNSPRWINIPISWIKDTVKDSLVLDTCFWLYPFESQNRQKVLIPVKNLDTLPQTAMTENTK